MLWFVLRLCCSKKSFWQSFARVRRRGCSFTALEARRSLSAGIVIVWDLSGKLATVLVALKQELLQDFPLCSKEKLKEPARKKHKAQGNERKHHQASLQATLTEQTRETWSLRQRMVTWAMHVATASFWTKTKRAWLGWFACFLSKQHGISLSQWTVQVPPDNAILDVCLWLHSARLSNFQHSETWVARNQPKANPASYSWRSSKCMNCKSTSPKATE